MSGIQTPAIQRDPNLLQQALGWVNVQDYGAVGDGVTDDTAAIQAAYDSMGPNPEGTLYFPRGFYFISKTIVLDGGYPASATSGVPASVSRFQLVCAGQIMPKAGIGDAFFIHSFYYPHIILRSASGGQSGDHFCHAEDMEGPYFDISAYNYMGTVFFSDGEAVPGSGGAATKIALTNGGRILADHCGQCLSLANYNGFGTIESVWDGAPTTGSTLNNMGDVTILSYENSIITTQSQATLLIDGCYSVHLNKVALGADATTPSLIEITNSALDEYSTGVAINQLFLVGQGYVNTGLLSENSGVYIGSLTSLNMIGAAVEQDNGLLMIGQCVDYGSGTVIAIGEVIGGTNNDTFIGMLESHNTVNTAILFGGSVNSGNFTLNSGNFYNANTSGGSNPTINLNGTPVQLFLGFVRDLGNPFKSLALPRADQLIMNPNYVSFLGGGVLYTEQGPTNTLSGTTTGTVYWIQPDTGTAKKFVAYFDAYENDTTTNQTITFPTAYLYTPAIATNTTGLTVSASTTTLTITAPNSTTTYSGVVEVVGI